MGRKNIVARRSQNAFLIFSDMLIIILNLNSNISFTSHLQHIIQYMYEVSNENEKREIKGRASNKN